MANVIPKAKKSVSKKNSKIILDNLDLESDLEDFGEITFLYFASNFNLPIFSCNFIISSHGYRHGKNEESNREN